MIRILLCCGGGFSSSALATRMQKAIISKGMEEKVSIEFYPLYTAGEVCQNYDIIMCCPHLKMHVKDFIKRIEPNIPIYVLPPRMYGMMDIEELYMDAQDVIHIYQETKENPVYFLGEEDILRVTRLVAHRKLKK
jgi:PTS system cellobiose-specific IIB component